MKKHPLDPEEKLSDKEYNNVVDNIQNERYASYIFWKKFWIFLKRVAIAFVICAILYFIFVR
jgi:hypothetical protein